MQIFNTSFEISLRILIILNVTQSKVSADRISALDFITIYGKDFGVSNYNLHGDNDFRFSEYSSKREIVSRALKRLVLTGSILPHFDNNGFKYSISENGIAFCQALNDEYAEKYMTIAKKANSIFSSYSDRKLVYTINEYAILNLGGKKQ